MPSAFEPPPPYSRRTAYPAMPPNTSALPPQSGVPPHAVGRRDRAGSRRVLRRLLVSYLALTLVECTGASFLRTHMLGDLSLALALLLAQAAAVAWAVLGHRRADADAEDAS